MGCHVRIVKLSQALVVLIVGTGHELSQTCAEDYDANSWLMTMATLKVSYPSGLDPLLARCILCYRTLGLSTASSTELLLDNIVFLFK
jgi:hypothetical protein